MFKVCISEAFLIGSMCFLYKNYCCIHNFVLFSFLRLWLCCHKMMTHSRGGVVHVAKLYLSHMQNGASTKSAKELVHLGHVCKNPVSNSRILTRKPKRKSQKVFIFGFLFG